MRAKFCGKFIFCGVEVYSYLDLDTDDFVWLEGGRDGKEMRRMPPPIKQPTSRKAAVDIPPNYQVIDFIKKYSRPIENPYTNNMGHIHWA